MLNVTVKKQIISQMGLLDYEHQRRVLDFARALVVTCPKGVPGKQLLSFAGTIPADDLKTMEKAIEDSCEKVDQNEW
ncbi:MAG: hypothetical protein HOE30_03870 [Deltaproteobacteria bacterium]|nr:hypothetical protein [Deltaproteobacteria bacterium]